MSPTKKPNRAKQPPALGQTRAKPWVRVVIVAVVLILAVGSLSVLLINNNDSSSDSASSSSTTASTAAAMPSVAGKPCVALADPLPAGAPAIPITVGPPPTQLVSKDLTVGTGATVEPGATVTVDYLGVSCSDGKIFDTSYGQQPVTFPLGNVIPGWQTGIPGMKVGGTRLLGIPSDQAYGPSGRAPVIAPDETLWFVVQVKDTKPTTG